MNLNNPLIEEVNHHGERRVTDVRWRLAPEKKNTKPRQPGWSLLKWSTRGLVILGAGVGFVSFAGQFAYIMRARHQHAASLIEALMFDVGMVIFTMLALALSMQGKGSKTERALIVACALASAGMGYAAADIASPRSVVAYVAPPLFLAVVVDRVVAVIRRHVLADTETSAWSAVGIVTLSALRLLGIVTLYSLRTVLAPRETAKGLRQMVLDAAPVPGVVELEVIHEDDEDNPVVLPTKKDRFLVLYRAHKQYGNRAAAGQVAGELAPFADLQPGTGRTYIYEELRRNGGAS